eukprot:Blabericola_migrator_1__33@NODE_1009_length_5717_cov_122_400531_g692_i0_p2_GENE_NODE_1009_length_5717_cov_122_400531_g692_i0NODE_1009_length_5717_cov_122_400531_g692_i0_p2_ORF_typecomplete_len458_score125_34Kin17_mid/PF10357_9/7_3e41zfC2H2_jaz/PF12171_8/0_0032zfC2H2_jaz/PF12171_8/2_9e03zfmet/PF12874_7/0_012KN17_SH3/PF18131_1/0_05zfC2H2_2/PF12756_7/0_024zfC2H2_2/PF12756_7/2_5e03KOW/PF00467_29/0_19DUF629/PF04780_12/0_4DUF629/PF04780_12/1_2e03_NODE_1009_length_5717_cov_122_400531_g692_i013942767
MPRAEIGSIKWLSNKMKAKGLQRLKWYCQMCEKQCRDENGFKCHMLSETHARQMQVFAQRPGKFMDDFSRSFEADFMRFMRTRYCRTRVLANTVYCELISNKQHIHMNATIWTTLSEFVRYLGNTGKCHVEKTERGWYLTYIDQDKIARERAAAAGLKRYISPEALEERRIQQAREAATKDSKDYDDDDTPSITDTVQSGQIKVLFQRSVTPVEGSKPSKADTTHKRPLTSVFDTADTDLSLYAKKKPATLSTLDKILAKQSLTQSTHPSTQSTHLSTQSEAFPHHPLEDSDVWVCPNLVVRVKDRNNQKGRIVSHTPHTHTVQVKVNQETLHTDQASLETVIPRPGRWAKVVLGIYRGFEGRVLSADEDKEEVSLALFLGPYWGDMPDDVTQCVTQGVTQASLTHYKRCVEARRDASALERGELIIHNMPFDSVCRVSPPEGFEEQDESFASDGSD